LKSLPLGKAQQGKITDVVFLIDVDILVRWVKQRSV